MSLAKHISVLITQVFCLVCFAQTNTIDSLKKILPVLKGTARIDCLNELGFEFSNRYWSKSRYQQTDTALLYTLQAQNESQRLHYVRGIGEAFQNIGTIQEERGNLKEAEAYTRKALAILEKENMPAEYHRGRVFLGWCLSHRGFFSQSIAIYKSELPYYEAIGDSENLAKISRMTARAYNSQGNSENAFTYIQKDFLYKKKPGDAWANRSASTLKAMVYLAAGDTANAVFYYQQAAQFSTDSHTTLGSYQSNMAYAYKLQNKYDSAILQIRESINDILSSKSDSLYREVALMNRYGELADLFLSCKRFDSAIIYCRKPIKFFKNGDDVIFLMPTLKTFGSAYLFKKDTVKALSYINEFLGYAVRTGAKRFERDGYKFLWQIYTSQHKTALADRYRLKYVLLKDSLDNDRYISQAAALKAINEINVNEIKFQNELTIREERNKAKINFINNEKKVQRYVFISAIALISLLTIVIVINSRLKRKKDQLQIKITEANILLEKQKREQEVAQLLQQKTELELQALRAQMNPHFIFNCLSSINRFILINKTEEASDYLTKFSRLIRMALHNSEKPFITLESEMEALRLYLDLEQLRFKKSFNYSIKFINTIDVSSVFIPPMLMQPLVENAIWHGLMHKEGTGYLDIALSQDEKILTCTIIDNGIGRHKAAMINTKSLEKNKSMGVQITAERLALLSRNEHEQVIFNIDDLQDGDGNASGTKVILKMKCRNMAEAFEY